MTVRYSAPPPKPFMHRIKVSLGYGHLYVKVWAECTADAIGTAQLAYPAATAVEFIPKGTPSE